jgi:hypothetical protein
MKIFVSHSSKDKWAARRIAKDLEELKQSVFLDEKDIATGDRIDDRIQANLKDCDHLLLLISPASLKSEWVLVELGGALALDKKVVPILLYVGTNEIPSVINLRLARDINDIGKYYEELGGLPTPPKAAESETPSKPAAPLKAKFDVGDKVIISTKEPGRIINTHGPLTNWTSAMDKYLGHIGSVVAVDADGDCNLDIDAGNHSWSPQWLKPVVES